MQEKFRPQNIQLQCHWSVEWNWNISERYAFTVSFFFGGLFERPPKTNDWKLLLMNILIWKKCDMKCGVCPQMKIWSSHLLDSSSNCLMNLKNSGDSTGFEPMTSAMPVQCSNQVSYKVTGLRADQFVGLMFSRERNVVWKKCDMKCGVWNQMKVWSSQQVRGSYLLLNILY